MSFEIKHTIKHNLSVYLSIKHNLSVYLSISPTQFIRIFMKKESNLVKKIGYNTKINEIGKRFTDHDYCNNYTII